MDKRTVATIVGTPKKQNAGKLWDNVKDEVLEANSDEEAETNDVDEGEVGKKVIKNGQKKKFQKDSQ